MPAFLSPPSSLSCLQDHQSLLCIRLSFGTENLDFVRMNHAINSEYSHDFPSQSSWDLLPTRTERILSSVNAAVGQARFLRRTSYALHGFLVGLHITLLVLRLNRAEETIIIPLEGSALVRYTATAMTISATIFATVYGALLICLTQRLALRRLLTSRQTLTAMHDEYNAWIGVGSALFSLYGQTRIRSALPSVTCISIYLVSAAILHVSIPAMFTLQITTLYHPHSMDAVQAYPNVYDMLQYNFMNSYDDNSTRLQALMSDSSSLLPYVVRLDPSKTIGLADATIYDRLAVNPGGFDTEVNATTFNVTCGALQSPQMMKTNGGQPTWWYQVSHEYLNGTEQENLVVKYIEPNNAMGLFWTVGSERSFYLYGTFDIEDSAGTLLPNLTLPQNEPAPMNVSIIGCDLHDYNHTLQVNTTSRLALTSQVPSLANTSTWSIWEPQEYPAEEDRHIIDLWGAAPVDQYETTYSLGGAHKYQLGFMEKYVVSSLGLKLPATSEGYAPRGRVKLHEVENALSRLAASYFWSMNELNADNEYGIARTSRIPLSIGESVQQLHLNLLPVAIGLFVSLALMVTNALLVRPRLSRTPGAIDVLDSLGLLQLIWFVRGHPDVLSTVGRVKDPNEDNLRLAGMFQIEPDIRDARSLGGAPAFTLSPMPSEPSTPTSTSKWREDTYDSVQLSPVSQWDDRRT